MVTQYTRKCRQGIPFVVTYNPSSPNLNKMIAKHFPILQSSNRCQQVFSEKPFIAYRRPRNLRDFLVKAKIKHTQLYTQSSTPTVKKCNSKKCKTCPFIQDGLSSCTFKNTGQTHQIKQTITCASKNLIYMIQCRKCKNTPNTPAEYIGQTKRPYMTDLENIAEPYRTRLPTQYPNISMKRDTNSQTSS